MLQKNWGQLILLSILLKLSLSPSSICLKYIFQLNWNSWLKSYIKHGNKFIILYQVLIVSRDRGKPIRDQTGLICFFYKKMDSVLKMSLSIEYHTKSDPPLASLLPNDNCGILKMVGPKKQEFWPRINILKGFFFFKICRWITVHQKVPKL